MRDSCGHSISMTVQPSAHILDYSQTMNSKECSVYRQCD